MRLQLYTLALATLLLGTAGSSYAATSISKQQIKTLQQQLKPNIQYLSNENGSCLLSDQPISQAVTVVYADVNKKGVFHYDLVEALPMARSNECIETLGTEGLDGKYFYRVDEKSNDLIRGYGFELTYQQTIYQQKRIVGINLFGQKIPHKMTECSSKEGTHFNIWQKDGAKIKKLLHRYTYLNMELESTCKNADYSQGQLNID